MAVAMRFANTPLVPVRVMHATIRYRMRACIETAKFAKNIRTYEETTHAPAGGAQVLTLADRMLVEGREIADVCRELQVSEQTYYR